MTTRVRFAEGVSIPAPTVGMAGYGCRNPFGGDFLSDGYDAPGNASMAALAAVDAALRDAPTFHVGEIVADGEEFPAPGPDLWTGRATDAVAALSAFSIAEGFSGYSSEGTRPWPFSPDAEAEYDANGAIRPTLWNDAETIASAPFTNTEVVAYTEEAIA